MTIGLEEYTGIVVGDCDASVGTEGSKGRMDFLVVLGELL